MSAANRKTGPHPTARTLPASSLSRVGSVPYLNAAPLIYGLKDQILLATPARLAELLQEDALDAALVSISEVLLTDRYDLLDGVAIASRGAVRSVFLAHRRPLEEVREVFCDTASLTSVNLLRVLLAERGVKPVFRRLNRYADSARHDFVLLIGDAALDFALDSPSHQIWDMGEVWRQETGLPFVYAGWALRRGAETTLLRQQLRDAKTRGLAALEEIVRVRPEYDEPFRRAYLGGNIRYELGPDEKRGISRFEELLRKHGLGPVHEARYVV